MPNLDFTPEDGGLPNRGKLKRVVEHLLNGRRVADAVIALTDVYTGHQPPLFAGAAVCGSDSTAATGNNRGWFKQHVRANAELCRQRDGRKVFAVVKL